MEETITQVQWSRDTFCFYFTKVPIYFNFRHDLVNSCACWDFGVIKPSCELSGAHRSAHSLTFVFLSSSPGGRWRVYVGCCWWWWRPRASPGLDRSARTAPSATTWATRKGYWWVKLYFLSTMLSSSFLFLPRNRRQYERLFLSGSLKYKQNQDWKKNGEKVAEEQVWASKLIPDFDNWQK